MIIKLKIKLDHTILIIAGYAIMKIKYIWIFFKLLTDIICVNMSVRAYIIVS